MNPFQFITSKIQASRVKRQYEKNSIIHAQKLIQAMSDGGRDVNILTPEILEDLISSVKQADENNYTTYAEQIKAIYKMYYAEARYGGEIARGIIDTRAAILCGEGLNAIIFDSPEFLEQQKQQEEKKKAETKEMPIQSLEVKKETNIKVKEEPKENIEGMPPEEPQTEEEIQEEEIVDEKKEQVKEFINNFIKWNKLEGEGLIEIGECGEMEGKVLIVLNPGMLNGKKIIKIEVFDFYTNKYDVKRDSKTKEITKITYGDKGNGQPYEITPDRAVFIQFSGKKSDHVKTPPRIANVLTQIENYSRAKYDLRKNNHLYSKSFLAGETLNDSIANSVNNDIRNRKFVPGKDGYVGAVKWGYVTQGNSASTNINEERIMDMKDIATTVGIPILLMNYPELMSNRATADTMMEMLNQSSKKERLKMQSGMIELFQKAMAFAEKQKIEGAINEPDMFDINIPLITLDNLKALIETWCVLMEKKIVSKKTVQGKVPGINPIDEDKQIQEETEQNIANNPIVQGTMNDIMKEAKGKAGEKIIDNSNKNLNKLQSFKRRRHVR